MAATKATKPSAPIVSSFVEAFIFNSPLFVTYPVSALNHYLSSKIM